jgi:hypothetical protein
MNTEEHASANANANAGQRHKVRVGKKRNAASRVVRRINYAR